MRFPKIIKQGSAVVKVYRVKHRTAAAGCVYSVAYVIGGARRLQQFADLNDAIEEARLRVGQLATGRIAAASISKPDRDELQAARQLAGKVPLLAALKEWHRAHEISRGNVIAACESWASRNGQSVRPAKVKTVVDQFLKAATKAGKQTADDHASIFTSINAVFGDADMAAVTTRQLDRWLAVRENPVSRNTYRKRIVAVWRWAQRKGYLARDTRTEAEMCERAHEPAPVVGIISAATFESLLRFFRAEHPEYLPALVVAGFAGLRRSEVHAQQWTDVNLEQKYLRVSKAKRGTPARRLVPLCDAAIEWLLLCADRTDGLCGNLAIDRIRFIAREARNDDKTAKFPVIPNNAFRHSYISHAVAATGDISRVSLDAGNSPKEIQRHYRELVTEAEGKTWFTIQPRKIGELIQLKPAAND